MNSELSEAHPITAVVPQSSKLPSVLFNIYCYGILTDRNILTAQYADDVAFLYAYHTINYSTYVLNKFIPTVLDKLMPKCGKSILSLMLELQSNRVPDSKYGRGFR